MLAVLIRLSQLFRSPARASRVLAEAAISVTSPVCRLPAFMNGRHLRGSLSASGSLWQSGWAWISPCTDRGQASLLRSLALITRTALPTRRPYLFVFSAKQTLLHPLRNLIKKTIKTSRFYEVFVAPSVKPYSKSNKKQPIFCVSCCIQGRTLLQR